MIHGCMAVTAVLPDIQRLGSLTLVMPAHNEVESLRRLLPHAAEVLPGIARRVEVVLVDDGSTDGSGELAVRLGDELGLEVRVIRHPRKSGYGISVADGLRAARMEYAAFTDADGQFDVADLALLVPALLGGAGMVAGWRRERRDAAVRSVVSGVFNVTLRLLYGLRVRDVDCALKLMRTDFLRSIELESHSALINAELFCKARRDGWRTAQVPVPHHPRELGRRSGARPRAVLRAIRELVRYRHRWR
jgi:glycosyltransferase involved in cell wall biosynthesis